MDRRSSLASQPAFIFSEITYLKKLRWRQIENVSKHPPLVFTCMAPMHTRAYIHEYENCMAESCFSAYTRIICSNSFCKIYNLMVKKNLEKIFIFVRYLRYLIPQGPLVRVQQMGLIPVWIPLHQHLQRNRDNFHHARHVLLMCHFRSESHCSHPHPIGSGTQ